MTKKQDKFDAAYITSMFYCLCSLKASNRTPSYPSPYSLLTSCDMVHLKNSNTIRNGRLGQGGFGGGEFGVMKGE